MTIQSKSIHAPKDISDGIRVCVMRRIRSTFDFDVWLPALAPSNQLLDACKEGKINWEGYVERFSQEVLENPQKAPFFQMLRLLSESSVVTLLCHEETDEKCHRRLLIEKLLRECLK